MNIFTDGSGYAADESAGYALVVVENSCQAFVEFDALPPGTTSNQAEMTAILRALEYDYLQFPVTIWCDNQVVCNSHNIWAQTWLARELRLHGVAVFANDTVLDMYRVLKHTIRDAPLELTNENGKLIANQHLWDDIWYKMSTLPGDVYLKWIPGHQEIDWQDSQQVSFWNSLADTLAKAGREKSLSYMIQKGN